MQSWTPIPDDDNESRQILSRSLFSRLLGYSKFFVLQFIGFKFYWTLYYIVCSLIGSIVIVAVEDLPFVDCVFMAASAMTGGGLATYPMSTYSQTSFMVMAILMMLGCSPFMLIPVTVYRRYRIGQVMDRVDSLRSDKKIPPVSELTDTERNVIADCEQVDNAVGILGMVFAVYFIGILAIGTLLMLLALQLLPVIPELAARGITNIDDAAFLAVSSFANAGLTMASDSLISLRTNPSAYIVLTILIVAGNTGLPICLRIFVWAIQRIEFRLFGSRLPSLQEVADSRTGKNIFQETSRGKFRRTLQFILDHPRRLTTHIFSNLQTRVLGWLIVQLIVIQYGFFLASTMNREAALDAQSPLMLAGIGYFQTLSTRAAGFSMMDLRELNQGLIVIYAIMMYLSAFPFVSTLQKYTKAKPIMVKEAVGDSGSKHGSARIDSNEVDNVMVEIEPGDQIMIVNKTDFETTFTIRKRKLRRSESQATLGEDIEQDDSVSFAGSVESYMTEGKMKTSTINKRFLKHYVFRHSFFLITAMLILAYSEDDTLRNQKYESNLWYVLFEVISAYGNVGLSMGVPGDVISLSGIFSPIGKCVLVFVMWLGKHRGLPSANEEVIDFQCMDYMVACRAVDREKSQTQ
jgi:Trk-type K+ transport system membrane component